MTKIICTPDQNVLISNAYKPTEPEDLDQKTIDAILPEFLRLAYKHRERILADPKMFTCEIPYYISGGCYIGRIFAPIGVLIQCWERFPEHFTDKCSHHSSLLKKCEGKSLVYYFVGSPLSGRNSHCSFCPECGHITSSLNTHSFGQFAFNAIHIWDHYRDFCNPKEALSFMDLYQQLQYFEQHPETPIVHNKRWERLHHTPTEFLENERIKRQVYREQHEAIVKMQDLLNHYEENRIRASIHLLLEKAELFIFPYSCEGKKLSEESTHDIIEILKSYNFNIFEDTYFDEAEALVAYRYCDTKTIIIADKRQPTDAFTAIRDLVLKSGNSFVYKSPTNKSANIFRPDKRLLVRGERCEMPDLTTLLLSAADDIFPEDWFLDSKTDPHSLGILNDYKLDLRKRLNDIMDKSNKECEQLMRKA